MEIRTKKDIRLAGRAIRENWPVSESVKLAVVKALMEIVDSRDPDLMFEAMDRLLKADKLNVDREAIHHRNAQSNEDRRLQLLELARRIPVDELTRIASEHSQVIDGTASEL